MEILAYLSILSGPVLACLVNGMICLIPVHNVLEYPDYWYEEIVIRILVGNLLVFQILIEAEFWSCFSFEKRISTYVTIIGLTMILGICINCGYYYVWTIHYEYSQPGALNHLIIGTIVGIVINATIWSR